MGALILCKNSIAANPYFIEEMSLNVYSLEELSYYIANNVYLLNVDFISVDLCNWIGRELGEKELQRKLLDGIKSTAPLHSQVSLILTASGYLSKPEIKQTLLTITTFESKSPQESHKMRADRLMEQEKLVDAIYEYESLLDDKAIKALVPSFEGSVWHNLGTAYARLFFFDEAALCFEQAYIKNHQEVSMRLMLASLRCNKNYVAFQELVDKYFIPDDVVNSIKEEVSALSRQEVIASFDSDLDEIYRCGDKGTMERLTKELLVQWKQQYTRLCRI